MVYDLSLANGGSRDGFSELSRPEFKATSTIVMDPSEFTYQNFPQV